MAEVILGDNQYGKAEVHLVRVTRDTARHEIEDINVTSEVRGDFQDVHLKGDNAHCVPTDTQKNTIFAFAREGVGSPEAFLLRLSKHFTGDFDWITGGRWRAEQFNWTRINYQGKEHDHSFYKSGGGVRTAQVYVDGDKTTVFGGVHSLTVLKTTESEFVGYVKDKYTTLQEDTDRIMSTDVKAWWRYNTTEADWNGIYADVHQQLLEGFAARRSTALQQTMYQMGEAVIQKHPEIDEVRFSMPNKHHFLVDLEPFGLDNPKEVFWAAIAPYGLIEGSAVRVGADNADEAWAGIAGFC